MEQIIERHQPWDECEAQLLHNLQRQLQAGELSSSRGQFQPGHLTASALLLNPSHKAVALVEHSVFGWIQPGGHIDPSDKSPFSAACREVLEECGVIGEAFDASAFLDVTSYDVPNNPKRNEPAHCHFDFRFVLVAAQDNVRMDGSVRWISLLEAQSEAVRDRSVRVGVERLCTRLRNIRDAR